MRTGVIIGILAMGAVVAASNVLVQFLYGDWLTLGAFTYPFAFLITDIVNRIYGARDAQKVVFAGFLVGLLCSAIGTQIGGEFGPLVSARVAIGSGIAFLIAQLTDILIFNRLRSGAWWRAPLASTVIGSAIDTGLFFAIAFSAGFAFIAPSVDVGWANEIVPLLGSGPEAPLWVSLAIADFGVKLGIALIALVPFRLCVNAILNRSQRPA